MVIGGRFSYLKADRLRGAGGQAVTQTIAVVLTSEPRLTVYHLNSALMTGGGTGSASVTLFFIDMNYFANHKIFLSGQLYSLNPC